MTADVYLGLAEWGDKIPGLYPDELPEEWREAYYATRFSCVWLSKSTCDSLTNDVAEAWLADTPDSFRFEVESGSVIPEPLRSRATDEGDAVLWFDAGTDLAALSTELRRRSEADANVYLFSRDNDLAQVEQVRTLIQLLGL